MTGRERDREESDPGPHATMVRGGERRHQARERGRSGVMNVLPCIAASWAYCEQLDIS